MMQTHFDLLNYMAWRDSGSLYRLCVTHSCYECMCVFLW